MADSDFSIQLDDGLPPEIDGLGERVREHMAEHGHAGGRVLWGAAGADALNAIRRNVSLDLVGGLGKAWATVLDLHAYKDPKQHPRGQNEKYALGANSVELEAEPLLVVRVGPFESPPMRFGYTVKAAFEATDLTIRDGAIQSAALGGCRVTGVLTYRGEKLHNPLQFAKGRLPGTITFDPPVRIP